mgnify:CR=1 FL=1
MVLGLPTCAEWGDGRTIELSGLDRLDVGARVLHHAVVALLDRPVRLDRDDGVDRDRRYDGNLLQGQDEVVMPGDMLSTADGTTGSPRSGARRDFG